MAKAADISRIAGIALIGFGIYYIWQKGKQPGNGGNGNGGTVPATLSGKVTDIDTGLGIAGVSVSGQDESSVTDSNGDYLVSGLHTGSPAFTFTKTGYETYVTGGVSLNPGANTLNVTLTPVSTPTPEPSLYLISLQPVLGEALTLCNAGYDDDWVNIPGYGLQHPCAAIPQIQALMIAEATRLGYTNLSFDGSHLISDGVLVV